MRDLAELEAALSEPSPGAIETIGRLSGDIIVLGAGGKMGPTLTRMVRRATDAAVVKRRVIAVSRFSGDSIERDLQSQGVETIRCDLLDRSQVEKLPDAPHVVFMTGMKFGSSGQESLTWAMNCYVPALVCERYRASRIVAFSTGNVYGLTPVSRGGSREEDSLNPAGDYAMSCLGRERMFEHFSRTFGTPMAIIRLNYAVEMRYGVLVDIARKVHAGKPLNLSMGYLNAIWQGDANAMTLQAFDHVATPPRVINVTGSELLRVRDLATEFGRLFGKTPIFEGSESPDALLSNSQLAQNLFGAPRASIQQLIEWIADWTTRGGETLGKPTHFEVRDGKF